MNPDSFSTSLLRTPLLGILFSFLFLLLFFPTAAQHEEESRHLRIRVHLDENENLRDVAASGIDITHGLFDPGKHFITDLSAAEVARLHSAGLSIDTLIADLDVHYRMLGSQSTGTTRDFGICSDDQAPLPTPEHFQLGSMGGFFTYSEMIAVLDSMRALFPNLVSEKNVLDDNLLTHEGRPIYWVRISDQPDFDEDEPEVAYTALHHAREPGSLSQLIYLMWYLLENYDSDPRIKYLLDETELYFVPCLNPDGYLYNESIAPQGGGMWRKNRRADGLAPEGVDLNRNYGLGWGFDNFGSSPDPVDQDYRGPEPFSEPETRMMRNFCQSRQFEYVLNYHSFGQLLIFPYGYNEQQANPGFDVLAEVLSSDNGYLAGTALQTVGYPVNGVSDDWMYGDTVTKNRIIAITPEISTFFWTAPSQIVPDCREVLPLNLKLASLPHHYCEVAAAIPAVVESTQQYLPFTVACVGQMEGQVTVTLNGNGGQFENFGPSKSFELDQYSEAHDSIFFQVADGVSSGTDLEFYLTIQDGTGSRTDTLTAPLILPGSRTLLFFEDGNTFDEWEASSGNWDTTSAIVLSPPVSISDSPDGQYLNNTKSELRSPLLVLPESSVFLRFWARWDIEKGFDYISLNAQIEGDTILYPLCGQFTRPGSEYQIQGLPIYDGVQEDWVRELVDLSEFSGLPIRLVFAFQSDAFVRGDGFFFDDLEVYAVNASVTQTKSTDATNAPYFSVIPNPASSWILAEWSGMPSSDVKVIQLIDIHGQVIRQVKPTGSNKLQIDGLANLPRGQYGVRLVGEENRILAAEKVILQ